MTATATLPGAGPLGLYAKLVLVAVFWGGMYTAGRILAQLLPHFTAATLRFAVASVILIALTRTRERALPRLDRRSAAAVLALSLTGVVLFNAFFFGSLERIGAGRGALIMALNPLGIAIGAWLFFDDRMTRVRWLGIGLALVGAAVVVSRGELATLVEGAIGLGELLMMGSALCWVAYTLIGRPVLAQMTPLGATTWAALIGTPMLAACAVLERPWVALAAMPADGWWAVAYLGVFGTVLAFLWFNEGVQRIGPTRAGVFINLVPVFGIAIGAFVLGEAVPASLVLGGLMVIAGVTLANQPARPLQSSR
ncbi:MAG: DMT family transporter [Burkholderiales bacterium]